MANTYKAIATVTVGSGGAADIEFTSIPSSYTDLLIKLSSRRDASGSFGNVLVSFNGSSANFTNRFIQGNGSSVSVSNVAQMIGDTPSQSETSNTFNNIDVYIPNYTSSLYKSFISDSGAETFSGTAYLMATTNLWSNTSAITSIKITNRTTGNFAQYSTATLYGINKS